MGPEVELLEYHAEVGADAQHLLGVTGAAVMAVTTPTDRLTFEHHFALLAVFQQVATAQQS